MKPRCLHIVYIISKIHKSLAFEWLAAELHRHYKVTFILLNPSNSPLEDYLDNNGITVKRILFTGKSDYLRSLFSLFLLLRRLKPDVIHTHLFDAQLLGLTAGWLAGIKKRVYTRHTSNYHHVYARRGIKFDRWSNLLASHIITLSQATTYTLKDLERVNARKIRRVPHGFKLEHFQKKNNADVLALKSKWGIPNDFPCIGVIARHIEWKGIQFIIPAFLKLLDDFPTATLILANADGPFHANLMKQIARISPGRYILIPFEGDVASLYSVFDLYVHTPIDPVCEAFGQTYVEALAAGVPSIFTKSGIAAEFIKHKENAWVVDFCESEAIYEGMKVLLRDAELSELLRREGKRSVQKDFGFEGMMSKLRDLYEE